MLTAMMQHGLPCTEIIPDGTIHRFGKNNNSWYIYRGHAGAYGDWNKGIHERWQIDETSLSPKERKQLKAEIVNVQRAAQEEIKKKHEETAQQAQNQWKKFSITGSSAYLTRKIVEPYNNHTLLCLDELGQIDGKEAGEIAYMLANGMGKSRLKARGGLRRKFEWTLLFLSTGEISIADKINEAGKKVQAGMLTRMVDIPADAGTGHRLFDTVHGFKDGNSLSQHLKEKVHHYYGSAIRTYLPQLVTIKEQLPQALEQIRADFFAKHVHEDADGQVRRVASRFVLVAAAGELAIKLGILPYEAEEALKSAGTCFDVWLESRGSNSAYEGDEAVRQVQAFLEAHHSSRFALMGEGFSSEEKIINQAGYKRRTAAGNFEFFIYPEIFRNEICKGFDAKLVCGELQKREFLIRGDERQFVKLQRLPIGRKKIYHLAPTILAEGNE